MPQNLINSLTNTWTNLLPDAKIDRRSHFFESGGDSLTATAMSLEVERDTGCAIPVGQIYLTPILEDFAAAVSNFDADDRAPLYIPLKPEGTGRPLFGIAPAMGGVFHFRELAEALSENTPFHVIEPRVSASGAHTYSSIRDLATCALSVVRNKQPQGPYRFAGFSFGGPLAWEMARILVETGERVDCLMLLDSSSRNGYGLPHGQQGFLKLISHNWQFLSRCREVRKLYSEPFRFSRWVPLIQQKLKDNLPAVKRKPQSDSSIDKKPVAPGAKEMKVESQEKLRDGFDPGTYPGIVHLFRAEEQLTLHRELDFDLGWTSHLQNKGLVVQTVPGDHFSLLKPPNSQVLADKIQAVLDIADENLATEVNEEVRQGNAASPLPLDEPVAGESYIERFLQVVRAYPERVALRDGGTRLTFAQLHAKAAKVASFLLEKDPDGEGPVLLHFQTSWQFICALYGVLLAGRYYVPVDTEFPDLRIQKIVTLSGATAAITLSPDSLHIDSPGSMKIYSFDEASQFAGGNSPPLPVEVSPEAPAVLLFTSGSTGVPKGAVLSRKMLLHVAWRRGTRAEYTAADRYGIFYISAFMGGVMAIHSPLLYGITLSIYNIRQRGLSELPQWMCDERITIMHMITSVMRRFLGLWDGDPPLPDLRLLIPGGERARSGDIELWKRTCAEKVKFAACLGSTECGTITMNCLSKCYEHGKGPIPVGKPFKSLNARILRADGSEAETLEEGQLVVESDYIFRGYLNAPELNQSVLSFRKDGKALYKTGDYGFIDTDGVFHNAGRRDSRVKVNGNLVELAEIESVLMNSGLVDEVAVVHRPLRAEDSNFQLVGFYRSRQTDQLETRLGAHILERLPRIMLPARWVPLTVFPETSTGKTDRRALAEMELPSPKKHEGDCR
ncbi:AMP-binding protein [Puniceicoccales bacterium CK1056]|uniref:AMP-binding protein n=1 Tax=Oceanipulchritudo coccoides TaxID=2706888 RepID=A0A6B2M3E5_9BACT|nr:AMP-binding protein [Oceanipulchritudo coccoides]NDV62936.1 AMP-binding protein [Oceanipulchritudo coccoides]